MMGGKTDSLGQEEPKALGQKPQGLATQEFGRPVPYFAGLGMMSGTFISEPFGVRSVPVQKKVGKKQQVIGYNYFASFAMCFCTGPVDRIMQLWLDDELFWEGSVPRGVTDYADITVTGFGVMRLYWGTETQIEDADLAASGVVHPAYRGQCYAVFKDWFLGQNKTNCPNVELKLQRTPTIGWIAAAQNIEDDANPVAVLAELIQSPRYGLGIAATRLDTASLNSAAARLADENIGISVYLNNASRTSQVLGKVMDHVDGWLMQQENGLLGMGLIRTPLGTPIALDETSVIEPPSLNSHLWWETNSEVTVKYVNRGRAFEADSVSYRDRASFAIVGMTKGVQVTRDWFTRQDIAWRAAAALCRNASLPYLEGSLKVTAAAAAEITVGSVIRLNYASSNLVDVDMRVTSVHYDAPDSAQVQIKVREERGYLNEDFFVPADVDFGEPVKYASGALYAGAVQELPFGWLREMVMEFVMQPTRGDIVSNGFTAWWERAPASFTDIVDSDVFWLTGATNSSLPVSDGLQPVTQLDVTFGGVDKTLDDVTYDEATHDPWVFFFIGDEILVPYGASLIGAGRYMVSVLRGRFGTVPVDITPSTTVRVLMVYRSDPATHRFLTPVTTDQTWKLQPWFMANPLPLEDCVPITVTPRQVAYAPLPPANPSVNGGTINVTYTAGSSFLVGWTETNELRDQSPLEEVLHTRADTTVIEITDSAGVLKGTVTFADTVGPVTISNATLVGFLGSETDFRFRLRYQRAGTKSLTYSEIKVWKV